MPRTTILVNYGCSRENAENRIRQILVNDGYCEAEQDGEVIWTKGDVILAGMRAIKVDYGVDNIKFSGWIRGLVGGETPLHGIGSMVTKRAVKKTIEKMQSAVSRKEEFLWEER